MLTRRTFTKLAAALLPAAWLGTKVGAGVATEKPITYIRLKYTAQEASTPPAPTIAYFLLDGTGKWHRFH